MAARIFMSGASASSAARRTGGERRPRSRPRDPPPRGAYRQLGDRQRVEGRRRQGLWVVRRPGGLPQEDRRGPGSAQVRAGEDGGGPAVIVRVDELDKGFRLRGGQDR